MQRRIRLASGLLLTLILLAIVFVVYFVGFDRSEPSETDIPLLVGALVFLAISYLLARSRVGRIGVWAVVIVPWVAIAFALGQAQPGESGAQLLYYSVIPVLLAGLVFPMRIAAALGIFNLAGILAAPALTRGSNVQIPVDEAMNAALFVLAATALALLGSGFLERSAREAEIALEKQHRADAFRLQLLNTVAHDLAAPLTPMKLQLFMLQREGAMTPRLETVQRNLTHLERLVGDVRDLSKMESGHLSLRMRDVDLANLANAAAGAFSEPARAKGLSVVVDVEHSIPLNADPDRLNQVLYNLITNAVKFTPPGGSVSVSAHLEGANARASLKVSDTGRGLTTEEMGRLFKPFSQVHDPSEVSEKGTGLGLYIARGIVEAHQGRIWVESRGHGAGSTFGVEIPVAPVPTPPM